jgi:glutamyl-tRNA reductase
MNYVVVGINHKTAPIAVRERLALDRAQGLAVLASALKQTNIDEATVISTCNRVELYGVTEDADQARDVLAQVLGAVDPTQDINAHLYYKKNQEAIEHLFEVTASLDSMVTGENQITGQVKQAFEMAVQSQATGTHLNQLFNRAFYVAKRVKTETQISKGNVSVGSVAVMLARKIFGKLNEKNVLLFGAGEIGELVLRYLNEFTNKAYVYNRTYEKAILLEDQGLGIACSDEKLPKALQEADVIVTSLGGGGHEQFKYNELESLMRVRRESPLFLIDLGVPRNIDPETQSLSNVYLYNVDDLQELAQAGAKQRKETMVQAKDIIDEEVGLFYQRHFKHHAMPTIASLGQKFETIRKRELERSLPKLTHLSESDLEHVDKLTQAIVGRVLHDPIISLKKQQEPEPGMLSLIHKIFRLNDEEG